MHWTRRVGILCLGLFSLGLGRVCPGQDNIAVNNGGVVYLDDFSGSVFLSSDGGNYLLFHKVVGEGVGHEDGYSRLGVRTRLWEDFDRQVFGEVHALITDDARIGYNIGGGIRKQAGGGILGVHGWYDDYETGQENRYRQITGGFEYLHPIFDIRSNAYIPIDETENFVGIINQGTDLSFLGNNLVTAGTIATERAYYGWDLEGGGPVPLAENWLRAYGGIYQLLFDDETTTGFRARAEARFMEGVNLNLILTEDEKYGTNVNLGVEVRFRGTMPTRFQSGLLADRRYDQVRRVWPVQTQVENVNAPIPVTNPGTDDPIQIVFIDNTNPGGTGTFEDPLEMLPGGDADADIFLVNTGSGSTFGNITLFDGQQILGAGKPHFIDTEQLGNVQLPSTFNQVSGNFPTLESLDSTPIITLANDNVVRGFNLIAENGIAGDAVNNFLLECLHSDVIENGIDISNGTGMGIIREVDFAVMSGGTGINVANSTSGSLLNVAISEVEIDGGASGIVVDANGGNVTYNIDDIEVQNTTVAGLTLAGTDAALNGTVDGTVFDIDGNVVAGASDIILNDNDGNGVLIQLDSTTGVSNLLGIEASNNGTMGMDLDGVKIVAENMSNYTVNIMDSTIDGAMDDGIDSSADDSVLVLNVDPTSIVDSLDNAFEFTASNDSLLTANFEEVDMTGALNDAINGMVLSESGAILNFTQFDASGAVNDGLDVIVDNGSSLTAIFDNSDSSTTFLDTTQGFSNSGSSAVNIDVSDDSDATLMFTDINADNMAADGGVNLIANMNSQISSTWTNGSISDGLATGVTLDATGAGSGIMATFTNVAIDRNAGDGIDASLTGGNAASVLGVVLNSVTLNENMNGLDYEINGSQAMGAIIFNEADLSNNDLDAFQFDVTGGAILQADTMVPMIPGTIVNNFSDSGSNAFQGTVNGTGSMAVINISDALAENSGAEGALLDNTFRGQLAFNYTNGSLDMSGLDGLSTNTESGALTSINLDTVTLDNNGQLMTVTQGNGLVATVDGLNSRFDLMLNDVSTSSNFEKGLSITTSNSSNVNPLVTDPMTMAMSRVSNTGFFVSTMNQEEGFYFDVRSGSTLTFNSVLGTTSNNGLGGNFSGVRGLVDGAGSAASVSFDNFSSDGNTQDGFEFDVTNDGMFIGEVLSTVPVAPAVGQLSSASNNMGAGITLNATGANTVAALIMDGNNQVNNNMEEGLIAIASDIEQLAIQATGQFNMNQGGDGILISATNINSSAIEVGGGVSSTSANAGDGVDITLTNSNMMDIDVTTLTQTATVEAFNVSELTANMNNGNGVSVDANMMTLADGEISDVTANGNLGDGMGADGDGIRVFFTDSTITDFSINGNGAELNQNNGINVELTRTDSTGLSIIDNVGAVPNLGINFLVDGSTAAQPFFVTNTSAFGFDITSFNLNLAPINGGFGPVFNTAGQGSQIFTPLFGTNLTTGLDAVNGVVGPDFSMAVLDNSQLLGIDFSDFNPSETFAFDIDLNANSLSTGNVNGNNLIGGAVSVDFNNGSTLQGTLQAVAGNPDAATFVAGSVSRPNTGTRMNGENGIRVVATDSQLTDTTISGNISSENTLAGINVSIGGALSEINNLDMSTNQVNMNMTDGISLTVNEVPVATGIVLDGNTLTGNLEDGIDTNFTDSTVGTLDISNNFVADSGARGFVVDATNTPFTSITMMDNNVSGSLNGDGVLVDLNNSDVTMLTIMGGSSSDNMGDGYDLDFNNSVIGTLNVQDMNTGGMGASLIGLQFLISGDTFNDPFEITNTSQAGFDITSFMLDFTNAVSPVILDSVEPGSSTPFQPVTAIGQIDQSDIVTGLTSINGVTVVPQIDPILGTDNTMDSVGTVLVGGGIPDDGTLIDLTFNDFNPGETFTWVVDLDLMGIPASTVNGDDLIGTDIRVDFTGGLFLTGQLAAVMGDPTASTFVATGGTLPTAAGGSNNTENGLRINLENSSEVGTLFVDNNVFAGNGTNGIEILVSDSLLPVTDGVISNNEITGNQTGDGIRLLTPDTNGTDFTLDILDNNISDNTAGAGVNIALNADAGGLTSEISGNTINNNGSFGLRVDAIDVDLDLTIGDSMDAANTFDNNANAGIAITLNDNVNASLNIENTVVSNTVAGADANYAGQGLDIRTQGNVVLTNMQIGDAMNANTSFTGNADAGISILADSSSRLIDPRIDNIESSGNTGDGLLVRRLGDGVIDRFTIAGSTFTENADGIDIRARHSDTENDFYTIGENNISMNRGRGISVLTEGDAQIGIDILFNTINMNGFDGIQTTASENNFADAESVTGNFLGNQINENGGDGIDINSVYGFIDGATIPLNIGMTGIDSMGRSLGNEIRGNEGNGIRFGVTAGSATIVNNTIAENMNSGIEVNTPNVVHNLIISENDILANVMHGIDLINNADSPGNVVGRSINATIDNNLIRNNERDGIQILSSGGRVAANGFIVSGQSFMNIDITNGNDISFNGGRGIDILVRGRGQADINIDDAVVMRNSEEGIYSVVTSSRTQSNEVAATAALAQDGEIYNRPVLDIDVSNSFINFNSAPGGYDGAGLVFRVGTSGSNTTPNGAYNDSWRETNTVNPAAGGGLIATIDNNEMRGNFGVDLWMHTFASTADPAMTTGAWTDQNENPRDNTNDVFDVDSFEQDPLARIRIDSFTGNTGDSADVFGAGNGTGSSQNFASYDNDESLFKSRTTGQDNNTDGGLDDDGPFSSGTRNRNATRLQARTTFVNNITLNPDLVINGTGGTPGNSDQFLYSGVGESTLQIDAGSDLILSGFTNVITDFTDAVGLTNSGLNFFDTAYYFETF